MDADIALPRKPLFSAIRATMTSLPYSQLQRNRYFYLLYDAFYAAVCVGLLGVMRLTHHQPLITHWDPRLWLLLPLACHAQILCSVWIHNATHVNFPRTINRLVGELCGVVVLTRFASWEIIHRRHHRYSDDVQRDPHPVVASYWVFLVKTVVGVERQLQRIFFDLHGETDGNMRYEQMRARVSYATNLLLLATWYVLLGKLAFVYLFLPASIVGFLHLVHFNWSTHDAGSPTGTFQPVNINTGYYRVGNWLWHGIYWHANHHRRVSLFNPGHAP